MVLWADACFPHRRAIEDHLAIIEFRPDGTVTAANAKFHAMMDDRSEGLLGRNHGILVEPAERGSAACREFWHGPRRAETALQEVRRRSAGGRDPGLREEYLPPRERRGQVTGIVALVSDVTEQTLRNADFEGKLRALDHSQGIIAFDLGGKELDQATRPVREASRQMAS